MVFEFAPFRCAFCVISLHDLRQITHRNIESLGTTNLKCYIGFVKKDPVTFLVNPTPLSLNINYIIFLYHLKHYPKTQESTFSYNENGL